MTRRLKEGVPYTLFFLIAIGLLLYNTFGILTIPGIIAAFIAIIFIYKNNYYIPAIIGILAASASFTGQYLTVYCPYCTMAAFCFFIGGIISLRHVFTKILPVSIALVVIISVSITMFALAPVTDTRLTATNIEIQSELPQDKPLLFVSPNCKACEDAVDYLIKKDPIGETWQPVIVPDLSMEVGKKLLVKKGYTGKVLTTSEPPGSKVPALLTNGELYEGTKNIENFFEGGQSIGDS